MMILTKKRNSQTKERRRIYDLKDFVQNIADQLFISRAALYRHITSLNEKTESKSRIVQIYVNNIIVVSRIIRW